MLTDDALRTMVYQAIGSYPPRLTRIWPSTSHADTHRAEGAYRAYLDGIALALGGQHPMGNESPQHTASWWALRDALDTVLSRAAATPQQPDYDATLRVVQAVAKAHGLAPHHHTPRPMSTQDRILAALAEVGQRAGCQVNTQPHFANTGRVYFTASTAFSTLVELSYHFDTDRCGLHFQGPAIDALQVHDSPPQFRYEHTSHGWQLGYHALRYADGERITAMLDLLTQALAATRES